MIPQNIDTAPKDGTAILTDVGVVCWATFLCRTSGWFLCYPWGGMPAGADDGEFRENPTLWVPLPDWMAA